MKSIDTKSIIIGALLASTIFLGIAATSPTDKWDNKQQWEVQIIKTSALDADGNEVLKKLTEGYEPFGTQSPTGVGIHYKPAIYLRKRLK